MTAAPWLVDIAIRRLMTTAPRVAVNDSSDLVLSRSTLIEPSYPVSTKTPNSAWPTSSRAKRWVSKGARPRHDRRFSSAESAAAATSTSFRPLPYIGRIYLTTLSALRGLSIWAVFSALASASRYHVNKPQTMSGSPTPSSTQYSGKFAIASYSVLVNTVRHLLQ